ncbi:MAG: type IV pilus secretin PilQ [Desulfobulbaceae bacterium]|nr:type IV pilus secretin PilQ [Desulfobulbaceae bacterium]
MKAVINSHKHFLPIAIFLLLGLTLNACVKQAPKTDPFFEQWRTKAETSLPYTPSRQDATSTLLPQQNTPQTTATTMTSPESEGTAPLDLPKTPLSVRFIDDDLATSLRTLALIAHQNIMISPSVKDTLSLQTQNTPWDTVFMGIINSYGLTVVKEDNLLHVMSMEDLKQQVARKTLQLQKQQASPLVTRIIPIEFSDPQAIADSVGQLLSKDKEGKPRGSATIDQHSRSLILNETEENMERLLALLRNLDKPTAQILIEAYIVETNKDTARELGIQWGAMTKTGSLGDFKLTPGDQTGLLNGELIYPTTDATTIGQNIRLGAAGIKGIDPGSIGLLANGSDLLLNAQLSALQRDGKLNILSRPSIATLDNSEAIIESGKSVPFQTFSDAGTPQVNYKDATLNLTVIPHVISDRMIKLNIVAKKDEVDTATTVGGNPYIIKKLAKTQLIVENNATVVLAGLSKETHSGSNSGVPGIKDVPGLGWLFKKDSSSQEFEELLIFITPKILTRPEETPPVAQGMTK